MNYGPYTGVGSRETPEHIQKIMIRLGSLLAKRGLVLRSGGADGADKAFEFGCDLVQGEKQIFLPWKGFNGSDSYLYKVYDDAFQIASEVHPYWKHMKYPVRLLHARNVYQVYGRSLKAPSLFLVCYTKCGKEVGGTATAIKLAHRAGIPVINLGLLETGEMTPDSLVQDINNIITKFDAFEPV